MMRQGRFALLALAPWLLAWTVTFFLFSLGGWRHAVSTRLPISSGPPTSCYRFLHSRPVMRFDFDISDTSQCI